MSGPRVTILYHQAERLGAGVAINRLLPMLRDRGWVMSGVFPGGGELLREGELHLEHVDVVPKPLAFSLRGWRADPGLAARVAGLRRYRTGLQRALRQSWPQLVHANTLLALPEATVARRLGLPIVLHIHELYPASAKRNAALFWAGAVADVIVAVSSPVAEMVRPYVRRVPVVVIRNGVPRPEAPRVNTDDYVVGTIGSIGRRKGTDVFVDAARIVKRLRPQIRFEHLGPAGVSGDGAFDRRVQADAAALGGAVTLLGPGDPSEVLRRWKLFVLPSREDPYPLVTLEAMAAGIPVIASDVGGLREQISHGRNGVLVPAAEPEQLARAIVDLHDNVEVATRLSSAALGDVARRHTLEAQAERLSDAYILALTRRYGPSSVVTTVTEAACARLV